jgi:hypothetical protein
MTFWYEYEWSLMRGCWQATNKSPLVSLIAGGAAGGVEATITYRKSFANSWACKTAKPTRTQPYSRWSNPDADSIDHLQRSNLPKPAFSCTTRPQRATLSP